MLPIFGLRGEEHEEEPVDEEAGNNEDEVEGEDEGAEGLATEARPSLAEYMEKWASLLAQHSKAVPVGCSVGITWCLNPTATCCKIALTHPSPT